MRKGISTVLTVRPKVAELGFQLFSRSLHPELFEIVDSRTIERGDYKARIDITTAGHLVTFRHNGLTLTEVACSERQPLPRRRHVLTHPLGAERSDKYSSHHVNYSTTFELERVPAEIFWSFQQELSLDGETRGMLQHFDSPGRCGMDSVSYVNVETRQRSLLIQTFHTFPDDHAIVKSQSLFQLD